MVDKYGDKYIVFRRAEWESWWLASGGIVNDLPPVLAQAIDWDIIIDLIDVVNALKWADVQPDDG